eukprot:Phypoly_transcript_07624.p1 GENE.Phypoly_transcript_07624~~Phypoly_transcript_07624.p1  ORF type:complete len:519 (+),score=78.08 Phypoly_transcript_07624:45-1601(+)
MNPDQLRDAVLRHPLVQQLGLVLPPIGDRWGLTYLQVIRSVLQEQDKTLFTLHSNLARLQDYSKATCDVVFEVGDKNVFAHSEIVNEWSVPLKTMLQSNMSEGVTRRIKVPTEQLSTVQSMVDFFYSCTIDLTAENAFPLLRLSCLYDVQVLRDKCCYFLQKNINCQNCLQILVLAQLHAIEHLPQWANLVEYSSDFIRRNKDEILRGSPFEGLQLADIGQIIPLFEGSGKGLAARAFLQWARKEWEVADLAACVALLDNEIYTTGETQIFIKDNYGQTHVVHINLDMSVLTLKQVLERKTSTPIEYQYLTNSGKVMRNAMPLEDCGITKDSTILLHTRHDKQVIQVTPLAARELFTLLYNFCVEEVVADFIHVISTPGWLELSSPSIIDIIKRDDLRIHAEIYVLKAISSWVLYRENRKFALASLLAHVRFPFMTTGELLTISTEYPVVRECSSFKQLLEEAITYQVSNTVPQNHPLVEEGANNNNNKRKRKRMHYENTPPANAATFASSLVNTILQ